MDYLTANDDGVEDEGRAFATNTNDPEEDSRTATFSLRGSRRASPEVVIIAKEPDIVDTDEKLRSSKRHKTEGAMQELTKSSFDEVFDHMGQEHTYRDLEEEEERTTPDPASLPSSRPRRTSKTKQQKTTAAKSKSKQTHKELTSSTSGPALGTRSRRASKSSTQPGVTDSTSMEGVAPSVSVPRQTPGKTRPTQVRIANLPSKVTLEELEKFLADFNHDPFPALSKGMETFPKGMKTTPVGKKKRKRVHSLLVNFQSFPEAQRAVKNLQGRKIRSRTLAFSYEKGVALDPQTASAPQPSKKAASQPSRKPLPPEVPRAIEKISDDEEGEIDESAPVRTLDLPATGSAESIHHIELINGAARQMAARVTKGKFKLDRTQQNFEQGLALLLSVQWPTVAAAHKTVPRDLLRRRLYGIIPFARYDKIRVCLQPTAPKAMDPEKCIVIYKSQAATTAAETYLKSKQFTEQNLSFTIEVERSEDIQETAATKAIAYRIVPKGVDRESLAIGIAGAARKEIANGKYTTKKYLAYCSNAQIPLFEEKPAVEQAPSERKSTPLTALVSITWSVSSPRTRIFPDATSLC